MADQATAFARRLGRAWSGDTDELVATTDLGTALFQRNVHRTIVKAGDEAGIRSHISAYDLRHSAITLQVESPTGQERPSG